VDRLRALTFFRRTEKLWKELESNTEVYCNQILSLDPLTCIKVFQKDVKIRVVES
jgi:hypothetical protein